MQVIFIAAMLGLPVLITAMVSDRRGALNAAAIIMAVIGVLTGHPMFMAADLFAVAIAYFWGMSLQDKRRKV